MIAVKTALLEYRLVHIMKEAEDEKIPFDTLLRNAKMELDREKRKSLVMNH